MIPPFKPRVDPAFSTIEKTAELASSRFGKQMRSPAIVTLIPIEMKSISIYA